MRRKHPLWRGFWLAAGLTAALMLLGGSDGLAAFRGQRRALAFALAVAVGALLGSLPGMFRRKAGPWKVPWQRCAAAFFCGAAMALGMGLAGRVSPLTGLMQGSTGAFAFVAAAWAAGLATVRIAERGKKA